MIAVGIEDLTFAMLMALCVGLTLIVAAVEVGHLSLSCSHQ